MVNKRRYINFYADSVSELSRMIWSYPALVDSVEGSTQSSCAISFS